MFYFSFSSYSILQYQLRNACRIINPKTKQRYIPSRTYAYSVLSDNKQFHLKTPKRLEPARVQQNYREIIQTFFNTYTASFSAIKTAPDLIINIDETPFFIDSPRGKVIIHSDSKIMPFTQTFPRTQNATLTLAITLEGSALPAQLIWHTANVASEFQQLKKYNIHVVSNSSGWQTDETFSDYLRNHLLSTLIKTREEQNRQEQTIVLLLDSHITRAQPNLLQYCRDHNIAILTFPSHSSHLVQPLDCGINAAIKTKISEYIDQFSYLFVHIILLIITSW